MCVPPQKPTTPGGCQKQQNADCKTAKRGFVINIEGKNKRANAHTCICTPTYLQNPTSPTYFYIQTYKKEEQGERTQIYLHTYIPTKSYRPNTLLHTNLQPNTEPYIQTYKLQRNCEFTSRLNVGIVSLLWNGREECIAPRKTSTLEGCPNYKVHNSE